MPSIKTLSLGKTTQTAGTVITLLVPPQANLRTKLAKLAVTVGATAHTLTIMRPLGRTTASSAAAASQAVINLTADPGDYSSVRTADNAIAANDYLVFKHPDNTYSFDIVSSVSSLAITMTTNFPTLGIASGAPVWFMGITTDTNPNDARAHQAWTLPASGVQTFSAAHDRCSFFESLNVNEPMIIHINNATNASVLEYVEAYYEVN